MPKPHHTKKNKAPPPLRAIPENLRRPGAWRWHVGCRQILAVAVLHKTLKESQPTTSDGGRLWQVAQAIEDEVYRTQDSPGREPVNHCRRKHLRAYCARIRSITYNMGRDGCLLGRALVDGTMRPERIATMDHRDMAPEIYAKAPTMVAIDDGRAKHRGLYRCRVRNCRSWDTFNHQLQTKGGDEAMTTFIDCRACGKRYKV